jgi:hypothetical protein
MKKILFALAIFFISLDGISQQKKMKDLVGRWEIVGEKDNAASLEVIDSSTIILIYNGEKKKLTNYKIDFAKSPIWFDFYTEGDSAATVAVKSLVEILNDNMIKWQLFVDEERTPYFSSSKGELFYLRKANPVMTTATPVASN